ncbi:MAG: response regulator [Gammaproteobacteria bacterium]
MNDRIRVLLVDDHAVVRAGFRMLLTSSEGIEVVAEAERGEQALRWMQEHTCDVVVIDLSMPGLGGLETIRRLRQRNGRVRILVFSVHDELA